MILKMNNLEFGIFNWGAPRPSAARNAGDFHSAFRTPHCSADAPVAFPATHSTVPANHKALSRGCSAFSQAGFSLVEIVIAVGIFSFVIVAVMGTMSVALSSTRDSEMKLAAAHTSAAIIGALKANPTNRTDTSIFPNTLSGSSPSDLYVDRQGRATNQSAAAFRLAWKLTPDATLANLVFCNIELTWPPNAPANTVSSHRVATSILLP